MPEVTEIQVEELTEIKISSKGTKYFAINHGQFVCFKAELHQVFAKLQGETVKVNITPSKDGKSARIESLATDAPQPAVNATRNEPQPATAPSQHLVQAVKTLNAGNGDEKTRAVALSYGKDLCAAGKITLDAIFATADSFIDYILKK